MRELNLFWCKSLKFMKYVDLKFRNTYYEDGICELQTFCLEICILFLFFKGSQVPCI